MSSHTTTHAHEEHHVHGGPKVYGAVLVGLLFLTVITVGASYVHWGSGMMNVIIAMLIASMKASLVALFFMHLRWDKPASAIAFVSSLLFLGLFLIAAYGDWAAVARTEPTNMKSAYAPGGQQPPAAAKPGAPAPAAGGAMPAPAATQAAPAAAH